ncbi:MAG: hypothetical protein IJY97_03290 [Clostridia bacterium]|nr:hypothetical protein [Clostridia bacterium]
MYLLRRIGIPLAALLILSVLSLITVLLVFEQNGIMLPSYECPKEEAVTSAPESGEITENNVEYIYPTTGGISNE